VAGVAVAIGVLLLRPTDDPKVDPDAPRLPAVALPSIQPAMLAPSVPAPDATEPQVAVEEHDAGAPEPTAAERFAQLETDRAAYAADCHGWVEATCAERFQAIALGYLELTVEDDVAWRVAGHARLGDLLLHQHPTAPTETDLFAAAEEYRAALLEAKEHGVVSRFSNDARVGLQTIATFPHEELPSHSEEEKRLIEEALALEQKVQRGECSAVVERDAGWESATYTCPQ
jgi:hypothetical protein